MAVNGGNLKKGMYIMYKNEPYLVTNADFVSPGKGSAFMRTKLKNVKTGNVAEFTFKSIEMIEEADVATVELQYLYQDGEDFVFMNQRSYEQTIVPGVIVADYARFMKPEMTMYIILYNEKPIGLRFPNKVALKVEYSEDAVAGNRVNAPKKKVRLETGAEVDVPLFIKKGDTVIIDTTTGVYVSRGE